MKLHERIRNYIEKNGVMLNFVAERSGIQKQRFYRIMNGKSEMSADEFEMICKKGLDVSPSIFFKQKFSENEKVKTA